MKLVLTDSRASWGQAWNQSMAVQLTSAGNLRARVRSVKPTGEKHSTTCRTEGWGEEGGEDGEEDKQKVHLSE